MTNRTQAIRLPKAMRLADGVTSVDIVRRGRALIIVPSNESWAEWFEGETVSDDHMDERGQPDNQDRHGSSPLSTLNLAVEKSDRLKVKYLVAFRPPISEPTRECR